MNGHLLDTHVLLWWLDDDHRLAASARDLIAEGDRVVVSDVSLWELSIKSAVGKFVAAPDVQTWFERSLADERLGSLTITRHHLAGVANMPMHHRDPFDRLLVAQARHEGLTLVSNDAAFDAYDIEVAW